MTENTLKKEYIEKFCSECVRAGVLIDYGNGAEEILFFSRTSSDHYTDITHCYVPISFAIPARFVEIDNTAIWNCKLHKFRIQRSNINTAISNNTGES